MVVLLTSLTSIGVIGKWRSLEGEYHALVLLGGAACGVMAVATPPPRHLLRDRDPLALALRALPATAAATRGGVEAAMKYFLLGSVRASAILLYGISLLYGATGGLHLANLALGRHRIGETPPSFVFYTGVALLVVGFGFKVAVVAVSHVGARRVPGLPDADHRVHGDGGEGGRNSSFSSACSPADSRRLPPTGPRSSRCSPSLRWWWGTCSRSPSAT